MFFNEKTYVGVVASGDDLLKLPIVYISFGPIKTNTHELGAHGWKLRMYQSTPLLRIKTRPKVSIHPKDNRHHGFRWKFRSRLPYQSEREVLEDLANEQGFAEFSLTKFEIKNVNVPSNGEEVNKLKVQLASSERIIQDMIREDNERSDWGSPEQDVFELLRQWNQKQIDSMDWAPKFQSESIEPDNSITGGDLNVVDFVEYLKSIPKDDSKFDEIMKKIGAM